MPMRANFLVLKKYLLIYFFICSYTIIHQLLTKLSQYFQDAFSLLAYSDPWNSPVGAQLDPVQREPVCAALNSAILGKSCWCST